MLKELYTSILRLRLPVRSLLLLSYVYTLARILADGFIHIAIYERFSDITFNIIAWLFYFTGIMIGFCIMGYLFSVYKYDIKYGFFLSFLTLGIGTSIIAFAFSTTLVCIATLLYGIGAGLFWLTIQTYELTETKDEERDFYSSVILAGYKILNILGPLVATLLLFVSKSVLHMDPFILLFLFIPVLFFSGLFCFSGIKNYSPEKVELADVKHFLLDKKNKIAQPYLAGNGMGHFLSLFIIPIATFFILGTEIKVGIFNTVAAIISSITILILGKYRNTGNRLTLLTIATFLSSVFIFGLGYSMTFFWLILFTVSSLLLDPVKDVSNHVITLQTMESIGRKGKDFYATMLLRDFSLWIWRMVIGFIFLYLSYIIDDAVITIQIGIILVIATEYLTVYGAYILLKTLGRL